MAAINGNEKVSSSSHHTCLTTINKDIIANAIQRDYGWQQWDSHWDYGTTTTSLCGEQDKWSHKMSCCDAPALKKCLWPHPMLYYEVCDAWENAWEIGHLIWNNRQGTSCFWCQEFYDPIAPNCKAYITYHKLWIWQMHMYLFALRSKNAKEWNNRPSSRLRVLLSEALAIRVPQEPRWRSNVYDGLR